MDLGRFLGLDEIKGRYFILNLPKGLDRWVVNVFYDFKNNYELVIELDWPIVKSNSKHLKIDYMRNIYVYDDKAKCIYEFTNSQIHYTGKYRHYYLCTYEYRQEKETVEPMFVSGILDDIKINYNKKEMEELLKNYW